ncbi:MAG: M14 family metallopeptidase [Candidatus Aminicenantes bacterium]|nr:M14 family metallopeptidase [Candidatus Aminicenantes bacterium]
MILNMTKRTIGAVILGTLIFSGPAWSAGDDFVIGTARVKSGSAFSGYLAVPEKGGAGTEIPFTVINGAKKGPVLALVAGLHAYEYPPILALYRLKDAIDPKTLNGTVLIVHIANLPSFKRRTIYYGPDDWKNLNRVFPGDPEGTMSQRIAAVLNEEVVKRADVLLDMHCGDGNEALIPYTYWMTSGDKKFDAKTRDLALAFGIPHIIIDDSRTKDLKDSKYLGNTAILRGKPAITTEAGYLGRTDEESVARNVRGVWSVMRHLAMVPGDPAPAADPVWIDKYEVIYSKWDGLFTPRLEMGYYVKQGQVVGTITDYLGQWKEDVKAPFTGILLYIIGTPPCNNGEPLFEVGRVKER